MVEDRSVSTTGPSTTRKKGLSAGVGDGRENELREAGQGWTVKKVNRGPKKRGAAVELAERFERLHGLIQDRRAQAAPARHRAARVERVRALLERGRLETGPGLERGVEGLLGLRRDGEDLGDDLAPGRPRAG